VPEAETAVDRPLVKMEYKTLRVFCVPHPLGALAPKHLTVQASYRVPRAGQAQGPFPDTPPPLVPTDWTALPPFRVELEGALGLLLQAPLFLGLFQGKQLVFELYNLVL
jgi:hypothetical protein